METETQRDIKILAIESSCDETAASVVKNGRTILSNVISSQIDLHKLYGGVVPEIASRKHIEKINQVIEEALKEAGVTLDDLDADLAMDAAACIGCGACAAACKNGSAMLFVSAKVSQLALLPQGKVEAARRAKAMVAKMDELGFGNCTNTRACEMECPKNISVSNIARLNREFISAKLQD